MKTSWLPILTILTFMALVGCDSRYNNRILIAESSVPVERIAAAVRSYADANDIPCSEREGTAVYCFRQPIHVFVIATSDGVEVCYLALGARFESKKFSKRLSDLQASLAAVPGLGQTKTSVPSGSQCSLANR